jgi:hypothetical protein
MSENLGGFRPSRRCAALLTFPQGLDFRSIYSNRRSEAFKSVELRAG